MSLRCVAKPIFLTTSLYFLCGISITQAGFFDDLKNSLESAGKDIAKDIVDKTKIKSEPTEQSNTTVNESVLFSKESSAQQAGNSAQQYSNPDRAAERPENFYALSDLYNRLSFSVGEVKTIPSPDQASFRDMTIPVIDGRLRLGVQSTYIQYGQPRRDPSDSTKQKVAERLAKEADTYMAVLALQYMKEDFSDANILFTSGSRTQPYKMIGTLAPRGYLAVLAKNLLHTNKFNSYFCGGDKSCESSYRSVTGYGRSTLLSNAKFWGRNKDEFTARAAVEDFLKKDKKTLFSWSKTLAPDISLVGVWMLPEYDFGMRGFGLTLPVISEQSRKSNSFRYYYHENPSAVKKYLGSSKQHFSAFLPMDTAGAEALLEELKAASGREVIYYVIQGRFVNIAKNTPELGSHGEMLIYELASPQVSLYKDAGLKEKIATIELMLQ